MTRGAVLAHAGAVRSAVPLSILLAISACADTDPTIDPTDPTGGDDLPVGDRTAEDSKIDGDWGAALECKPIPNVPSLVAPKITISLDGLTLHLVDTASGYDRVFPIGPGSINQKPDEASFRESLSYYPIIHTGQNDFVITPQSSTPCKTWWTDKETGEKSPVFAGLPFMSWWGNYAIHGPIDKFRAPNGGTLRRGYVSHGCIRMEAADVLEVYARIKSVARVPVHVQREPEKLATGKPLDVASKWVGASCESDSECGYANGFCAKNAFSTKGTCSAKCTTYCSDRPGYPSTFCVADPVNVGRGMCVPKVQAENFECRPYDHLSAKTLNRNNSAVTATVCTSGSRGWVGDHCFADTDCGNGTTCRGASALKPGVCSQSCERYCPDQPGWSDTFCANVPALGVGGSCVRQCTPSSNGSECPADMTCSPQARNGGGVTRHVCMPRT